jgi:branched-chain amino acid transport system permease protein
MAFLGGLGTVSGPVLGALIIEPTQQYLTTTFSNSYLSQILLGALFLAVVIFLPRGIIPTAAEKVSGLLARRRPEQGAAGGAAGPARGSREADEAGADAEGVASAARGKSS